VITATDAPNAIAAPCATCGLYHARESACPVGSRLPIREAGRGFALGTVIAGRFEIVSVEHRSEMSTIFRAKDHANRADVVAVKQVCVAGLTEHERAEAQAWLAREAGLLSSLTNSHLPELLAAFSEGDNHYVVMPYIAGETLKERVRRVGPLPEHQVVRWANDLTDVLACLHGQRPPVIHRDLKPDNILVRTSVSALQLGLGKASSLILLDLGVARPLARGCVGTAIGTPGYAPPEQYQGLADERSDLYALGATLHYLLTAYDAEYELPFRHPLVRQLNPAVTPAMERLIASLLELAPDRRPASVKAVRRKLARVRKAVVKQGTCEARVAHDLYSGAAFACLGATLSAGWMTEGQSGVGHLVTIGWAAYCLLGIVTFAVAACRVRPEHRAARIARRMGLLSVVSLALSVAYVVTGSTQDILIFVDWLASVPIFILLTRAARSASREVKELRLQLTGGDA